MGWTKKRLIAFENKVIKEFNRGKINCPVHLSGGNEEHLIEIFKSIKPRDWVVSTHRNHYHYLLKGGNSAKLLSELRGDYSGVCCGCGRSMHIYDSSINFITSGIVAGGCAIAVGLAVGMVRARKKGHVYCFIGDGAEDSGHFAEAVRYSEARELPITYIIEDNDLSIDVSKKDRWGYLHELIQIASPKIIRYDYRRKYGHVGTGKYVSF